MSDTKHPTGDVHDHKGPLWELTREGQIVWLGSTPRSVTTVSRGLAPGTPNWTAGTIAATWHPATG